MTNNISPGKALVFSRTSTNLSAQFKELIFRPLKGEPFDSYSVCHSDQ